MTRREILLAATVLGALGISMSLPLWGGYWFSSHEYGRYVTRTVEFLGSLRDGFLVPRWAPDLYGGFGSPLFDFFPPGVFALSAPLAAIGLPVVTALKLAMVTFTVGGALGACALAHGETGRLDAALVAGTAFLFAPYRFVDLFLRGDLAEYAAFALLPWALFFYREITRAPAEGVSRAAFFAAVCHAGVLLTHPVIGQWATEVIAVLAYVPALRAWDRGERFRAVAPLCALAGAAGLAAVYVLPALTERGFVRMERAVLGYFDPIQHLVPFGDLFKFDYYAFVPDLELTRMPFSVGIPLTAASVAAAVALLFPRSRVVLLGSLPWWLGVATFIGLMLPPAAPLYGLLPFATYVQFPWRFLGFVAVLGATAIGATWAAIIDGPILRKTRWLLAALAIAVIALGSRDRERVEAYYPESQIPTTPAAVAASVDATTSAYEHLPRWVPAPPEGPRSSLVSPQGGPVRAAASPRSGTEYVVDVTADDAGSLDLELFYFPGWAAKTLSGPAEAAIGPSPDGLVELSVPRAGSFKVDVSFGATPVRTAAAWISLATLLLLWPGLKLAARVG